MIIVGIAGGLGNQMFQYAFYRALMEKGKNVKIDLDLSWHGKYEMHNGYELHRIFSVKENVATKDEIKELVGSRNIFNRFLRRYKLKKTFYFTPKLEDCIRFNEKFLNVDNIYLFSAWQTEKYFSTVKSIIEKEFVFKLKMNEDSQSIAKQIMQENSVSIHVRRGDYLNNEQLRGICTVEYFTRAIERIKQLVKQPRFYVFSDDIQWCKEHFLFDNIKYVSSNSGIDSYQDMQLMSLCKHNITSNSTFSWWGAWLNKNVNKIVISPKKWFNGIDGTKDIIPDEWMKV